MASFNEQRDLRARPAPGLMTGSSYVALGVSAAGLSTMCMLGAVSRLTEPTTFAAFAAWWIAATLLVFPLGVFEVLLARLVIGDVAMSRATTPSVGAIVARAGTWSVVLAIGLVIADEQVSAKLFDGIRGLPTLLGCFLLIGLCQTMQRGLAAGRGTFGTVGLQLATDGVLRVGFAAAAAALLPTRPAAIAGGVCLGSATSVALLHVKARGWATHPRLHDARINTRLSLLLLAGSTGPILINNASVPWLTANGAQALTIGAFAGALTLSRVPVQLSASIFGPLLNRMSHAIEAGDHRDFRTLNRRAVLFATLFAGGFAGTFTIIGGVGLRLLIGSTYTLPTWTFACLGFSSALMLISVVVQAQAAAEQMWAAIAGCWIAAAITFAACLAAPVSLLERASGAPLVGSFVALASLLVITQGRNVRARPQSTHQPSADR